MPATAADADLVGAGLVLETRYGRDQVTQRAGPIVSVSPGAPWWGKIKVPGLRLASVMGDVPFPGASSYLTLRFYYSTAAAEDGSTLVEVLNAFGSGSTPMFYAVDDMPGIEWVYVQAEATTSSTISVPATVELTYAALIATGAGPERKYGSTVKAATKVAQRTLDRVDGRTTVALPSPVAADDILSAQDVSAGGSAPDGLAGFDWGEPMTANTGEPQISIPIFGTYSRTSWHKLYLPERSVLHVYDDGDRALAANTVVFGTPYGGTVMGLYRGPENAGYGELTLIGEAAGSPVDTNYGPADVTVTLDEGWIYIQHAYLGDLDGYDADTSATAVQRMYWTREPAVPSGPMTVDPVVGRTDVRTFPQTVDPVAGFTTITAAPEVDYPVPDGADTDDVDGRTTVEIFAVVTRDVLGDTDPVVGYTAVGAIATPDLSDNPPINLQLSFSGQLELAADGDGDAGDVIPVYRHTPIVTVSLPTMVIANGQPVVPKWAASVTAQARLNIGPGHIRAEKAAPVWDGSGYVNPPPPTRKPWAARWVVDDLPDPGDGFYWLGDPSDADGTRNIGKAKRAWNPHDSTRGAPAWHSRYPFKPSVRAANHYLPGGRVVHHPKGVHFNPQYIEHMYMNWGSARPQPFTWVMAGMIVGWPGRHYRHYLLDAGGGPGSDRFPRLGADDLGRDRPVPDGLDYRTLLAMDDDHMIMTTKNRDKGQRILRARAYGSFAPRMFFGVFNGSKSVVGHFSPNGRHIRNGRVENSSKHYHRYYVLGRQQGIMSQDHASNMLLFEIRFWHFALDRQELDDQYQHLASTYHFNAYRRV